MSGDISAFGFGVMIGCGCVMFILGWTTLLITLIQDAQDMIRLMMAAVMICLGTFTALTGWIDGKRYCGGS